MTRQVWLKNNAENPQGSHHQVCWYPFRKLPTQRVNPHGTRIRTWIKKHHKSNISDTSCLFSKRELLEKYQAIKKSFKERNPRQKELGLFDAQWLTFWTKQYIVTFRIMQSLIWDKIWDFFSNRERHTVPTITWSLLVLHLQKIVQEIPHSILRTKIQPWLSWTAYMSRLSRQKVTGKHFHQIHGEQVIIDIIGV